MCCLPRLSNHRPSPGVPIVVPGSSTITITSVSSQSSHGSHKYKTKHTEQNKRRTKKNKSSYHVAPQKPANPYLSSWSRVLLFGISRSVPSTTCQHYCTVTCHEVGRNYFFGKRSTILIAITIYSNNVICVVSLYGHDRDRRKKKPYVYFKGLNNLYHTKFNR